MEGDKGAREETEVKKRLTCPCLMSLQLSDQRVKSLESSVEAERATHRESKFKSELIQVTRAHVVSDRAVSLQCRIRNLYDINRLDLVRF